MPAINPRRPAQQSAEAVASKQAIMASHGEAVNLFIGQFENLAYDLRQRLQQQYDMFPVRTRLSISTPYYATQADAIIGDARLVELFAIDFARLFDDDTARFRVWFEAAQTRDPKHAGLRICIEYNVV